MSEAFETGVKRFVVPGWAHEDFCPECRAPKMLEFSGIHYLSYPTANEWFEETLYCHECEKEWTVWLRLKIAIDISCGKPE